MNEARVRGLLNTSADDARSSIALMGASELPVLHTLAAQLERSPETKKTLRRLTRKLR